MGEVLELNTVDNIINSIYIIRGQQVMLDSDLAKIYGYEVKRLNEQVKRNIKRFPEDFMFQLTREEIDFVKSQFATSRMQFLIVKSINIYCIYVIESIIYTLYTCI